MIDVLKRLAELDAVNPNVDTGLRIVQPQKDISVVVKENTQVEECGMMTTPAMERPSTPASINMTAGSGEELSSMIKAIATLAGTAKGEEVVTGTPTAGDSMRSVIDKLNPEKDEEAEEGFLGRGVGGLAGGALGKAAGTALGTAVAGPIGGAVGGAVGDVAGTSIGAEMGDDDDEKKESYDNTPADPTDTNEFDAEQHAHHENPPGAAKGRGNHNNPRANTMEEIEKNLFAEYKKFVSERSEKDEEMDEGKDEETDEGIEDRLKDLDPKNPVNIPAYQRKAKSGDSAAAAKNTREGVEESSDDILKLAGLK